MVKKKTDNIKEYQKEYYKKNRERILLYAKHQRQVKQGGNFSKIKKEKACPFKIERVSVVFKF
tara:strand:+ start:371 stop:559 length:189 start_codon:yes stop_codon:yes gene_type:complete